MIRLEEKAFELGGRRYVLRCNMAVLEMVEEANGDFESLMKLPVRQASLELLAAMMNDYSEDQGWDEHWTPKTLKKKISYAMLMDLDLVGMMFRAIQPESSREKAAQPQSDEPGDAGN